LRPARVLGLIDLFRTAIGPRRPSHNVAAGETPSHVSAKARYRHDATNLDLTPSLFDTPADLEYAKLRHHLEQAGTPIGPNDMLIAAHALATESILVTANKNVSLRVPGLTVENWLEALPSV
jgi:predicted nucleic acid-binding protein